MGISNKYDGHTVASSLSRRVIACSLIALGGVAAACGGASSGAFRTDHPTSVPTTQPSVTTVPTSPAPGNVKPPLTGLIDRGGLGTFTLPTGVLAEEVDGVVANVRWADIQPTPYGPIVRGAANQLDVALQEVAAYNAANPRHTLQVKLRLFAGVDAPEWVKTLGGFTPVSITNEQQLKSSSSARSATIGPWWTTAYQAAYAQLQAKLATIYDGNPLLREVTISGCMTVYAEPFQRDDTNFAALYAQGYSVTADETCMREQIDAHKVWTTTHSSLSVNPWSPWVQTGSDAVSQATPSIAFPAQIMSYCRQVLGTRCTLENNSIRQGSAAEYQPLFDAIDELGPDITFQTATSARIGDVGAAIAEAISLGANAVELPGPYSLSQATSDARALMANPEAPN